jgi:hypothetical protein
MFAWFSQKINNFHLRRRILYARGRQAWRLFKAQIVAVRRAVVLDFVITFLAILSAIWFESNKPARYALAICFVIEIWVISRRLVLPVLGVELVAEVGDRVVHKANSWWDTFRGNIPWWASWVIGKPGEPEHNPTPASLHNEHPHANAVWHEVSVGGHIFHLIGTIAMWKNVLLLLCGMFPIWERDWLSVVVMLTVYILFFVWTEDFVDIKKWRARLGYVVAIIAILYLGAMALRTLAPGTYTYWMAKFGYNQEMKTAAAEGVNEDKASHVQLYRRLQADKRAYENRYQIHLDHAPEGRYDADWTETHTKALTSISERMATLKAAENAEDYDNEDVVTYLHPLYIGAMGILLVIVGIVAMPLLGRRTA